MPSKYVWAFDSAAEKQFSKFDSPDQRRILRWLDSNIQGCENPRLLGKALEGAHKTLWRYSIGKYRLIADIHDGICQVLVIKVARE